MTTTYTAALTLKYDEDRDAYVLEITDADGELVWTTLYASTENWTPGVYDRALTGAGYRRMSDWTPDGDDHTCTVRPI